MKIKEKLELMKLKTGDVYNVVPLTTSTISAYKITKDDFNHIVGLASAFARAKNHPLSKIVLGEARDTQIIKLEAYPLPGFVTRQGHAVVNLSAIPVVSITDYQAPDIYSTLLYTISLGYFMRKRPFGSGIEENISNMFFMIFMSMYGKKTGLTGSYKQLIPKLRFILWIYVSVSFLGEQQDEKLYKRVSSKLYIDYDELNLNYDFNKTTDMLECLNKNNIIPISLNRFSNDIISRMGMSVLPMFEDTSRFFSTIMASSVAGNSVFPAVFRKISKPLFDKLNGLGSKTLSRLA